MPNVWITSHCASGSPEAQREALMTVLADVLAVRAGQPPAHPVPELRDLGAGPSVEGSPAAPPADEVEH